MLVFSSHVLGCLLQINCTLCFQQNIFFKAYHMQVHLLAVSVNVQQKHKRQSGRHWEKIRRMRGRCVWAGGALMTGDRCEELRTTAGGWGKSSVWSGRKAGRNLETDAVELIETKHPFILLFCQNQFVSENVIMWVTADCSFMGFVSSLRSVLVNAISQESFREFHQICHKCPTGFQV